MSKRKIAGALAALAVVSGTAGSRWMSEPQNVEAGRKLGGTPVVQVEAGTAWTGTLVTTDGRKWR